MDVSILSPSKPLLDFEPAPWRRSCSPTGIGCPSSGTLRPRPDST
jgi:hypothetical protein